MARSEAQKKADKEYYNKTKGKNKSFTATLPTQELEQIRAILDSNGIGNADLIRRAAARIEQGDDLTREYDRETDSLKPL